MLTRAEAEAWIEMHGSDQLKLLRSMSEAERWEVLGSLVQALGRPGETDILLLEEETLSEAA